MHTITWMGGDSFLASGCTYNYLRHLSCRLLHLSQFPQTPLTNNGVNGLFLQLLLDVKNYAQMLPLFFNLKVKAVKAAEGDWLMCGCDHYWYLNFGSSQPSHFAGPYLVELFAVTQGNQSMYLWTEEKLDSRRDQTLYSYVISNL